MLKTIILGLLLCSSTYVVQAQLTTSTQDRVSTRIFDVVGVDNNGGAAYFTSMIRNKFVNLPHLTYTIKRSGTYLIILSAVGGGSQEKNNIYSRSDHRTDYEGEIRLSANNSPGSWYLVRKFFYTHFDAADATQDATEPIHSDDGEKSLIKYFKQGEVIQVNAFIQQKVGSAAPAQKNPWNVRAQVKYILLD